MAAVRTKNLPDVTLCHTLSIVQTMNFVMLNDALIKVTDYLKPLALRVYIVHCPQLIPNNIMINKHKMDPTLRGNHLGDVIFQVARKYFSVI